MSDNLVFLPTISWEGNQGDAAKQNSNATSGTRGASLKENLPPACSILGSFLATFLLWERKAFLLTSKPSISWNQARQLCLDRWSWGYSLGGESFGPSACLYWRLSQNLLLFFCKTTEGISMQ